MRLSSQEEYGLRCLLQVALHGKDEPLHIHRIATSEGLSPEYAAKLMRILRQGGLVVSTRGAGGGYQLSRPAHQINLQEVIDVLDGPLFRESFCSDHSGKHFVCVRTPTACTIRSLWANIGGILETLLKNITIADLCGSKPLNIPSDSLTISPSPEPTP